MKRIWSMILIVLILIAVALFAIRPHMSDQTQTAAPQIETPAEVITAQPPAPQDAEPGEPIVEQPTENALEEDELSVDDNYEVELQEDEIIVIG